MSTRTAPKIESIAPLAILRTGCVTSAGLNAPSTFAALRARLNNFTETTVLDSHGEPLIAACIETLAAGGGGATAQRGSLAWQADLLELAMDDCLRTITRLPPAKDIPLLLCVSEVTRPGRPPGLDEQLLPAIEKRQHCRFAPSSQVYAYGKAGIGMALADAFKLLDKHPLILLAGVDSLAHFDTLQGLHARGRVLDTDNANGVIPGEAACCLLLGRAQDASAYPPLLTNRLAAPAFASRAAQSPATADTLFCMAASIQREPPGADALDRANSLTRAITEVLAPSKRDPLQVALRVCSQIGTDQRAREMAVASARASVSATPLWCLADSLGETGAAAGPLALAWAYAAMHKGYAPGPSALSLLASDEGEHCAVLLGFGRYQA